MFLSRLFYFVRPAGRTHLEVKGGSKKMIGKSIRMERITDRNSGKTVIVPMDHGVTIGPDRWVDPFAGDRECRSQWRSKCPHSPQGSG